LDKIIVELTLIVMIILEINGKLKHNNINNQLINNQLISKQLISKQLISTSINYIYVIYNLPFLYFDGRAEPVPKVTTSISVEVGKVWKGFSVRH